MAQPSDLSNVFQSNMNAMQSRYNAPANAINSVGTYLAGQAQQVQQLQQQQASDLSKARTMDAIYYGGAHAPQIDALMANNPYARRAFPQQQGQSQAQPQGMAQTGGNPNMFGSMIGAPGTTAYGTGMLPTPTATGDTSGGTGSGVSMNPVSTGMTVTSGGLEPPKFSQSIVNPVGEQVKSQASAQGEANVAPSKEFGTKMAASQAQAQENLARDSSQMTSVFATLKNLRDIHSALGQSNLSGTDLGDLVSENLGHIGTAAALMGQKPADWQNSLVSPQNQALIGQFQAARNEGITRAVQPMQNQVDKTGSSRIMDSMLDLMQGEYGKLDDPSAMFDGKTIGTAKTLYRITLASQNYADQLKAKGITLNSSDPNFNPDSIAKNIVNQAQGIQFSPGQSAQFNKYANQMFGTKNMDYSGITPVPVRQSGGSLNPVTNPAVANKQGTQAGKPINMQIAQQLLLQAGGDKDKARQLAKSQGYSF